MQKEDEPVDEHAAEFEELENNEGVGHENEQWGHILFSELAHEVACAKVEEDPNDEDEDTSNFVISFETFLI